MSYRIAVASTDGQNIDLHFAQAVQFYIYDISDNDYTLVEVRTRSAQFGHDETEFDRTLLLLQDCSALFVSQIGYGAAQYIASRSSMRIFEAPYSITKVLNKVVSQQILQRTDS